MLLVLALLLSALVLAVFAPALAEWLRPVDTLPLPIAAAYTEDRHRGPTAFRAWRHEVYDRLPRAEQAAFDLAPMLFTTDVTVPTGSHLRTFYGDRQVWLEPGVSVEEWLYGHTITALDDARLAGSVEAEERLHLLTSARFERLHAPTVQFGPEARVPETPCPTARFVSEAARAGQPVVRGALYVPGGVLVEGDVIATGDLSIGPGSHVRGSVKAGGKLHLERSAVVEGSAVAEGDVLLGSGVQVRGVVSGEADVYAAAGVRVGRPGRPATLTGEHLCLAPGVTVHGTVWARVDGVFES